LNGDAARDMVAMAMRDFWAESHPPLEAGVVTAPGGRERALASVRMRTLLVLRTLETVIDRERVDRVLPEFLRASSGHVPSTAKFAQVCSQIAGRNLDWFFREFIFRNAFLEIELRRLPSESPGVVAGEILVRGLPTEGSVRVEMKVRTAQGMVEHSVATHGAVTPFTVNVPAPAQDIALDPDLRILRWTEGARRSQAQSQELRALPSPVTHKTLPAAIALYRRALAADPDDASLRAQALRERLGELEWAHDEWNAALDDLDAAINGYSISAYETYLCRGKAYLYHGLVELHERRPAGAREDAQAGLALTREVLSQPVPEKPIESHRNRTLEQLLQALIEAATHSRPKTTAGKDGKSRPPVNIAGG